MKKNISIKVYTPQNNFLKEWKNFSFQGFNKQINAGVGECIITLFEKFDYSGGELTEGNLVTITIADKDTLSANYGALIIYQGYISFYEPDADGKQESITVHLLGHYTKLAADILKNAANTTMYTDSTGTNGLKITAGATAADVGNIVGAILDRYAAETVNPKVGTFTIPIVGQNLNYIFTQKTYREALDIALSSCPSGYFYYIDAYGGFTLKTQNTVPTHTFVLEKNISNIHVGHSMENIRNVILFWDGASIYKKYEDAASIAQYGRRVQCITDTGIQDATSMDNIAAKYLLEHKDPDIKVVCIIPDNNLDFTGGLQKGYDIESIEPGDTCRFLGFNDAVAFIFRDNMLITEVQYSLGSVTITIENFKTDIVTQAKRLQDQIASIVTAGVPNSYT
jgi:hypothetical protein